MSEVVCSKCGFEMDPDRVDIFYDGEDELCEDCWESSLINLGDENEDN